MIAKVDGPFLRQIVKRNVFFFEWSCVCCDKRQLKMSLMSSVAVKPLPLQCVFHPSEFPLNPSTFVFWNAPRTSSTLDVHLPFIVAEFSIEEKVMICQSGEESFRKQYKRQHSMRALMDVREGGDTSNKRVCKVLFFFLDSFIVLEHRKLSTERTLYCDNIAFSPPWHFNLQRFIRQE